MKNKQHTPGPWTLIKSGGMIDLKGNCGNTLIATWETADDGITTRLSEEDEANLILIAAAPEMLEALKEIEERGPVPGSDSASAPVLRLMGTGIQAIARAAIAKATKGQGKD